MVATLLEYCGLGLDDIDHIYLAGGFGTHIDLESAVTVGIYPDVERKKMVLLGNTYLDWAKKLLLDAGQMARVRNFEKSIFPLYRRKTFGYNAFIYAIYEK